jgi:hypothetical protein
MSTRLPLSPDADKIDAALLAVSDATVVKLCLVVLVDALVEDVVALEEGVDALEELAELAVPAVGAKVVLPLPKPRFEA